VTAPATRWEIPDELMVDLNGHEAGNGGYSQRTPTAHRVSSTRNSNRLTEARA
jgi:hypothetical protein